jgi:MFS family permease
MTNPELTITGTEFKDRKTGLIVFGILQIILGAICALMVPFMILGAVMSATLDKNPAGSINIGAVISGAFFYALAAASFIWLGIGSIKARRLARALILIFAWLGLISGLLGIISMIVFMPDMYGQMAQKGQIPEMMAKIIIYAMIGFMGVIYIVIPGALVLFYGRRDVKLTCERRNPQPSWTDKCPLPVLAISLMYGIGAVGMPMMGFYNWVTPFFGYFLTGLAGAGVTLGFSALYLYIAWGTYKLKPVALWSALLIILIWAISAGITFSRFNLIDFYAKMNFPPEQLELMKLYIPQHYTGMAVLFGIGLVGFIGYIIYIKRYFKKPASLAGE